MSKEFLSRVIVFIIGLLVIIGLTANSGEAKQSDTKIYKVYINQLVKHPALDATTRGIIDGLEQLGLKRGKNLDLQVEFAQGNSSLSGQIATKFLSNEPDIVVGNATVAAQSFARSARNGKTKLIFTSVTDPLGAGLVRSLDEPGNNTSGVSNFVELEPQIKLFKEILPDMKKLGFIYNPGEANSIALIKKLQEICPNYGIELVLQTANKSADVPQSTASIASKVEAIFISNDNTALSAMGSIVRVANKEKIPVFVSDTDIVPEGAVAALGPNQYQVGIMTAKMIYKVLQGRDINQLPVEFPDTLELVINKKAADKIGLNITKEMLKRANRIL